MQKLIILLCVLLWSSSAVAKEVDLSKEHVTYCAKLGVMYALIAQKRDQRVRPEYVLNTTADFNNSRADLMNISFIYNIQLCDAFNCFAAGDLSKPVNTIKDIPLKLQKRAINQVYFDHAFENAGGGPLIKDIQNICIYGMPKPFKPLK